MWGLFLSFGARLYDVNMQSIFGAFSRWRAFSKASSVWLLPLDLCLKHLLEFFSELADRECRAINSRRHWGHVIMGEELETRNWGQTPAYCLRRG